MLPRRAYKELCRAAAHYRMHPSEYVESLALRHAVQMELLKDDQPAPKTAKTSQDVWRLGRVR
jgi:hypothetical protein